MGGGNSINPDPDEMAKDIDAIAVGLVHDGPFAVAKRVLQVELRLLKSILLGQGVAETVGEINQRLTSGFANIWEAINEIRGWVEGVDWAGTEAAVETLKKRLEGVSFGGVALLEKRVAELERQALEFESDLSELKWRMR
jgi:hypothetical protein